MGNTGQSKSGSLKVSDTDKFFLKECLELARKKMWEGQGGPFAALVVKDGKIIASGWNSVLSTNDPTAHAEVQAIRKACENLNSFQLENCIVYCSCEPCPMCLGALYWARPKRIVFTSTRQDAAQAGFDDQFIYDEIQQSLEARKIPTEWIELEGNRTPFEEWLKKSDRVSY